MSQKFQKKLLIAITLHAFFLASLAYAVTDVTTPDGDTSNLNIYTSATTGGNIVIKARNTGTGIFVASSTNNIGIGNIAPDTKLLVQGDTGLKIVRDSNADQTLTLLGGDGSGLAQVNASYNLQLKAGGSNPYGIITFITGASTETMRINSTGNVGIATTTPVYGLDVVGTARFTQPIIIGTPTGNTHAATKLYVDSAITGGTSGLWLLSGSNLYASSTSWNVGIGTTTPSATLTVVGSSTISNALNVGSGKLYVSAAGNIGVGTTTPSQKIHVQDGLIQLTNTSTGQYSGTGFVLNNTQSAADKRNLLMYLQHGTAGVGGNDAFFMRHRNDDGSGVADFFNYDFGTSLTSIGNTLHVAYGGNVGIATTTPVYGLDVVGTARFTQPIIIGTPTGNTHAATKLYVDSAIGASSTFTGTGTASYITKWTSATGLSTTTIYDSSGNIGIGTSTPGLINGSVARLLDVVGAASAGISLQAENAGGREFLIYTNIPAAGGAFNLYDTASSTNRFSVFENGDFLIGPSRLTSNKGRLAVVGAYTDIGPSGPGGGTLAIQNIFSNTTAAADVGGTLVFGGETGNAVTPYAFAGIKGAKQTGSGDADYKGYMALYTGSAAGAITERMRIDGSGNVGIATTTPIYGLDVVGTARFTQPIIVGTPTGNTHAATKLYVDSAIGASSTFTGTGTASYITKWTSATGLSTTTIYDSSGNIGIGTASPLFKTQVSGALNSGGGAFLSQPSTARSDYWDTSGTSNPFQPNLMVRSDSTATTLNTTPTTLVIYNSNGANNNWAKIGFAMNEATANSNPVSVAGIGAEKTAGTAGAWASGDIVLWTKSGSASVEVLRGTSGGFVGIGTTTPVTSLEILGSTTNSSLKIRGLELQGFAVNNEWLADNVYYNGSNFVYRANGLGTTAYFSDGNFLVFTTPTGTAGNTATMTERFRVSNTGGISLSGAAPPSNTKIALGTLAQGVNTPAHYLLGYGANTNWPMAIDEIYDGSYVDHYMTLNGYLDGGTRAAPTFFGGANGGAYIRRDGSGNPSFQIGAYAAGAGAARSPNLTIDSSGNVGIATTTPAYKLDVVGTGRFTGTVSVATPVAGNDAATKDYVTSASGLLTWQGYTTTTYNGALGNITSVRGANQICQANYAGSHWASLEEIVRLGSDYPWTSAVWMRDGLASAEAYNSGGTEYSNYYLKDGNITLTTTLGKGVTCTGWTSNSASNVGSVINTSSYSVDFAACNASYKLACVSD